MGSKKSIYLEVASYHTKKLLSNNPNILRQVALETQIKVQVRNKTREELRYDETTHRMYNNKKNAITSTGCGCLFCVSRHNYAKTKFSLHKLKRAFESDFYYYNPRSETSMLRGVNVDYFESERERFFRQRVELEEKIRDLRSTYLRIKHELLDNGIRIVED